MSLESPQDSDIAQLAKGGRANVVGFGLRLVARIPFLIVGGRIYGAAALGRMAYAVLVVEFASQVAANGMRRGLAQHFADAKGARAHQAADAMLVSLLLALPLIVILGLFPIIMFPAAAIGPIERIMPLIIVPFAWTDIMLAALAYQFNVAATVRARSVVEPWAISIVALALVFLDRQHGLLIAYMASIIAAFFAAAVPFFQEFGWVRRWRPRLSALRQMAWQNLPLSAADAVEWGSRRIDLAILGWFVSPALVGVYYVAVQIASLPQKLKSSFDPVLGPVIARKIHDNDRAGVAAQINQVGFWIMAAQLGIGLAFGLTATGIMGLVGSKGSFVVGSLALILLMAAEVVASLSVVSEAALVYIARKRNMLISAGMIGLQAALTYALLMAGRNWLWPLAWQAASPAAVLAGVLLLSSILKSRLASQLLASRVHVLRWPLVWAAGAASGVGAAFYQLPEWVDLAAGIPAIIIVYSLIIWRFGFAADDRALFRRNSLVHTSLDPEMA